MSTAERDSPTSQHTLELFRLLVAEVKDYAIFLLRPDGTVASWNAGAERTKGYTAREIIGRHFSTFYTPEDVAAGRPQRALAQALLHGRFEDETWRMRKDGSRFWANVVITPLHNEAGELLGFSKITRDLTERRAAEEHQRELIREQAARAAAEAARKTLAESEERLREANEKLGTVVNGVADGITMQDLQGRLVYANDVAARILGYPNGASLLGAAAGEIVARYEFMHADGTSMALEELPSRQVLRGLVGGEQEVRLRNRVTGEDRWTIVRASPVHDSEGGVRYGLSFFRDVTEQRRKEEELRISHEWFATVLRSIGDAVITTDPAGAVTFMNPIAEKLTGWSAPLATGKLLREVFPIINETTRKSVESPVERAIREGRIVGLANHTILLRRDGGEVCIADSAAPIRDGSGQMVGVVLVFRDVSEERREERWHSFLAAATVELNSSLDYQSMLATVARLAVPTLADWCAVDVLEGERCERVAVAHVDPEKIKFVEAVEARYPPDPAAPNGVPNILRTGQPEILPEIPEALILAAAKNDEHLELIRKLGLHSYMGVPLTARGRTIGAITFVMAESNRRYSQDDLTVAMQLADRAAAAIDNARLFRESQRARAEAELANRSKDEFLAILGHELRNPLAPIQTALQLMKLRGGDALERERTVIERQVKHVVRLVDDLLDVSRITRGKVELRKEPVSVAEIVGKAIEMASPLLEERQHELEVAVPPELKVYGDVARLSQVISNLLNNAAKYTERAGHVAITAERSGNVVVLRVRDSGIGIAPEMLPRIFEPFVQESQALDRSRGGLGLGLSIVRSLVALHGGSVSAYSEGLGSGTEVIIKLPLLESERHISRPPAASAVSPSPRPVAGPVLLVDDNTDAAQLLAETLEVLGYECHVAHDGPSALTLSERSRPSVAILDIGLPVMDGYELARRLRAIRPDIKLIALTGYGQSSDRQLSAEAGFDSHLVKPVDVAQLIAAFKTM